MPGLWKDGKTMSDIKWIKICTDIFDDDKILLIESMPEADGIIVIWFKLLCMAGKQNNSGVFMLNDRIAYNDEMLATIFRRPVNVVRLALSVFEQYGMIEIVSGTITIPKWEKHQSIDKMEEIKEQTRLRVAKHREKQKLLASSEECNVTVTLRNATDKKREDKIREDKINYEHIKDMYNDICISFPRLSVLSDKRKQAIKARSNTYTVEQFKEMFEKAEASDFMKGANDRNWMANFDWMMKDANFAKILDGNYDNKPVKAQSGQQSTGNIFVDMLIERGEVNEGDLKI